MLRLSLGLGVSSSSKLPSGGAAPSGIPVAANASVIVSGITGGNSIYNGTYTNDYIGSPAFLADTPETILFTVRYRMMDEPEPVIVFVLERNQWEIGIDYSDDNGYYFDVFATNPSSNQSFVPTAGWSPSLTITAA